MKKQESDDQEMKKHAPEMSVQSPYRTSIFDTIRSLEADLYLLLDEYIRKTGTINSNHSLKTLVRIMVTNKAGLQSARSVADRDRARIIKESAVLDSRISHLMLQRKNLMDQLQPNERETMEAAFAVYFEQYRIRRQILYNSGLYSSSLFLRIICRSLAKNRLF